MRFSPLSTRVDQVLVGATRHDAITNMALRVRDSLRSVVESDVFSANIVPGADEVIALDRFPGSSSRNVIIFHGSYGDPTTFGFLQSRPEKLVLAFHNLSPAELFESSDPLRAAFLHWGWRELEILRDRFVAVIADSEFNRDELHALGYDQVEVIPAGVDPWRLSTLMPDERVLERACGGDHEFVILYSGQSLQHKRLDVLVHATILMRLEGRPVRLVIAGMPTDPVVHESLVRTVIGLGWDFISILGSVSDEELLALFGRADLLATASTHEGLCLPILEAMAMGVPVVARAIGAVPSTSGGAAVLIPESSGPSAFAAAMSCVMDDPDLRELLVSAGLRNAERFLLERNVAQLVDVVVGIV